MRSLNVGSWIFSVSCLALVLSCSRETKPNDRRWEFPEEGVVFDAEFSQARLNECVRIGPDEYGLVTRPENIPVNNSPWFAFRVSAATERLLVVRLRCQGGSMRYRPKISLDGLRWVTLPTEAYEAGPERNEGILRLEVGPEALWVAAQELVSIAEIRAWAATMERLPFVSLATFGESAGGRPLFRLDLGTMESGRHVSIIGRQHPPETTGSLALMRFVEELAGDSELARDFRREFHVRVIPLVNPDGVDAGNWRHNLGGVDLNRDWGSFAQPETKAVSGQIEALHAQGRLYLHLDFHSTFRDVFYTQDDDAPSSPAGFTPRWLEGIQRRVPEYTVNRSASPVATPTTSAHWAHRSFGIPGITYEIGDNTDRALLKRVATAAAGEMMALLLELKDEP